jgi:8-oxo-dGTP pyrophosphatase MutT (NUDIX family)
MGGGGELDLTMNEKFPERKTVFATPWFQVQAAPSGGKHPNYSINSPDFVCIIALTEQNELLLVRQFRHAVAETTLELPAGHVEKGESHEEAARKELLEETGYVGDQFELVASLSPSTSRFTNRMWCYFVRNVRPAPGAEIEAGLKCVRWSGDLKSLVAEPAFYSCGNWAALMAAVAQDKLSL